MDRRPWTSAGTDASVIGSPPLQPRRPAGKTGLRFRNGWMPCSKSTWLTLPTAGGRAPPCRKRPRPPVSPASVFVRNAFSWTSKDRPPCSSARTMRPRIGVHRGRRAHARFVEMLRATGCRMGLLTNGRQVRLCYAGLDHDAWCEWGGGGLVRRGRDPAATPGIHRAPRSGGMRPGQWDVTSLGIRGSVPDATGRAVPGSGRSGPPGGGGAGRRPGCRGPGRIRRSWSRSIKVPPAPDWGEREALAAIYQAGHAPSHALGRRPLRRGAGSASKKPNRFTMRPTGIEGPVQPAGGRLPSRGSPGAGGAAGCLAASPGPLPTSPRGFPSRVPSCSGIWRHALSSGRPCRG